MDVEAATAENNRLTLLVLLCSSGSVECFYFHFYVIFRACLKILPFCTTCWNSIVQKGIFSLFMKRNNETFHNYYFQSMENIFEMQKKAGKARL